jgi:Arc/MetJ-type ribon-helix-helix transcriptional regulator
MIVGMTRRKIAITIPEELLTQVKDAVARGEATSVSAYISDAVAQLNDKRPYLQYFDLLDRIHGTPSPEDEAWADEQLRGVGILPARKGSRSTRAR